jgi:hypothetical protein
VNKCNKKKSKLPLTPVDPWRGLGTKTSPTRAHWLIKTSPKSFFFQKKCNQPHVIMEGLGSLGGMNASFKRSTYALPSFMGRVQKHEGE